MTVRGLVLGLTVGVVEGAHWAVLVAGSSGYWNYRHQADVCHSYHVLRNKGIPAENIITLSYDDVASSTMNPFPGQLFNKPSPKSPGVDVYAGCAIDYKGADVTPDNFMKVLTGKAAGKSLKSTASDNVFIYFADHGATGLIAFPHGELYKADLQKTLQAMHDAKMYKKLTFYLEACESGSMFQGVNVPGVYAVSAASPYESSWGTYCGADAVINGKSINSCLGDLFSVSWMEDSDASDTTKEDLQTQYGTVKTLVSKSKVMQWSDTSFTNDKVSEYIGGLVVTSGEKPQKVDHSAVNVRHIDLAQAYHLYTTAPSGDARIEAGELLMNELNKQLQAEKAYRRFVALVYPNDKAKQQDIWTRKAAPGAHECEKATRDSFKQHGGTFDSMSGFTLGLHQVIVNICADVAESEANVDLPELAAQACKLSDVAVV